MKHERIKKAFLEEKWAITPTYIDKMWGVITAQDDMEAILSDYSKDVQDKALYKMQGNTAVMDLTGPIFRYANLMTMLCGAASLSELNDTFTMLDEDPSVKDIVINMNTPGGQVTGISDFAAKIKNSNKFVTVYVEGYAASAGYWIASAADKIIASDTASMGSIGVIASVPKKDEEEADSIDIISSQSPFKRVNVEEEEGRSIVQTEIDDMADVFINTVATNRNTTTQDVVDNYGKGSTLIASKALAAGMIDGVGTIETVIETNLTTNKTKGVTMSEKETMEAPEEDMITKADSNELVESTRVSASSEASKKERERVTGLVDVAIKSSADLETLKTAITEGKDRGAFAEDCLAITSTKLQEASQQKSVIPEASDLVADSSDVNDVTASNEAAEESQEVQEKKKAMNAWAASLPGNVNKGGA